MSQQANGREPGVVQPSLGRTPSPAPIFYQASTLNALMLGNFDGTVSVGELKRHGSWGIGTYEGLDGEAVICEGRAFCAHADGTTCEYADDQLVAFSTVADFTSYARAIELAGCDGLDEVRASLEQLRRARGGNDNAWYLVALHGVFPRVRVRSCAKQAAKPYPTLPEVARCQHEHTYQDEHGWIIGVWTPAYLEGINLPGWHLHYLSDDREHGGHLLDAMVEQASGRLQSYLRFQLDLPRNEEFGQLDLGRDLAEETSKVEG